MKNRKIDNPITTPVQYLLQVLGGKWKLPILCILSMNDVVRFNELKRKLDGITNMSLSNCLNELEHYQIIDRVQYLEMPPRVEYSLSEKGKELLPLLKGLDEWIKKQL
ncbi:MULTISPECIES: helix-turn-helix domain-containing protein [unclassified Clostridium]|uniref:winged helix-turn-helix transcriptional regulator n=1 Tax=unclassified Clostridium TaxID=2614128 RepID=UPI000298438F|nr:MULTISPECIES: helix-turn-helix domain-containing protein [unclassified Clostridium]EKQ53639.1 MAG: putative transcriptional regulator [Clostridium sp. Maddingley MBC34-26]